MNAHLEGEYPYLGDLLTISINHLLTGMILQVLHEDACQFLFNSSSLRMILSRWAMFRR